MVTQFTYSPTRRWLTRIHTTRPGGADLIDNTYTRDLAGRILTIARLAAKDTWVNGCNFSLLLRWLKAFLCLMSVALPFLPKPPAA